MPVRQLIVALVQGGSALVFLRRDAAGLATAIGEMAALVDDLDLA